MKFGFGCGCFRISVEVTWLEPTPDFRLHRLASRDAGLRRRLMGMVSAQLKRQNPSS